jgi:hypothetical protein
MSNSSSSSAAPASLTIPASEKLKRDNYRLWRAQVLSAIWAAQLEGFIDAFEKAPLKNLEVEKDSKTVIILNPEYARWHVWDQHVLTYLVISLSHEVLAGVASNSTFVDMWTAITKMFASQSRSRVLHLRNQLVATRKGDKSISVYFSTMRGYANEIAAATKTLDDDDVVSYIMNGLDVDYNSLIEQVNGTTELISLEALYSRLPDTEVHLIMQKAQ